MVNHVGPSKNLPVVFQMQLLGTVLNFKSLSKMSKPALIVVVGLSGIALAIETIHAIKNC